MINAMNKKIDITKFILFLFLFLFCVLISPFLVSAQGTGITYVCTGGAPGECTFDDLIRAVQRVVNWGTVFALQFSVIVLAYAGFKYMTSGDNPGERKEANRLLTNVVKGIALIIGAWLMVRLIITALGVRADTFLG